MSLKSATVWAMVWLRVALAAVMVWGSQAAWPGVWLAAIVGAALVDDIYDGILARRWACETSRVRVADSLADTVFYFGAAVALWLRKPEVLRGNWILFAVLLGLEGLRYIFDWWKFGRTASYHSYMAKAWGLLLAAAMIGVFAVARLSVLVPAALAWGIAVNLEGLAMSLMLPRWKNDVKTLACAWRLRQQMLAGEFEPR